METFLVYTIFLIIGVMIIPDFSKRKKSLDILEETVNFVIYLEKHKHELPTHIQIEFEKTLNFIKNR